MALLETAGMEPLSASLASLCSTAPAAGEGKRSRDLAALEPPACTVGGDDDVEGSRANLFEASIETAVSPGHWGGSKTAASSRLAAASSGQWDGCSGTGASSQLAVVSPGHWDGGSDTAASSLLSAVDLNCSVSRTEEVQAAASPHALDDDASATSEHESAMLALEEEIRKMGENIDGGLEETQETVFALMQRLTSCEANANQRIESERDKAETMLLKNERSLLMSELEELRCITSKNRVQKKLQESSAEKTLNRAIKAESKVKELEAIVAQKAERAELKRKKLVARLEEADGAIKSLQAQVCALNSSMAAQEREAASREQVLSQEVQELRNANTRREADHARVVSR